MIKAVIAGAVLALCLVGVSAAGPLEDGLAAAGRGDYATALRLWRPLADQGDAEAQYGVGELYDNGVGVPQDHAVADSWFRKAADQGLAAAQNALGFAYSFGWGVPQDDAQGMLWYRKAADQGYPDAQRSLSVMYGLGQGAPEDDVQAYMWIALAISRFPPEEAEKRDEAIKIRDATAARMTPAQIDEAQRLAREWTPK